MRPGLLLPFCVVLGWGIVCSGSPPQSWSTVEQTLGLKGAVQPDGVFKIAMPRSDLDVQRGAVRLAPGLALTSWMAFKDSEGGAAVTHGDLCLREAEVNPVMTRLQQGGIETTALHNHLSGEQPRVMFLHFWGRGEAKALATTLKSALEQAGGAQAPPKPLEQKLDQQEIEKIMGQAGRLNAGVLQFGIPRPFPIRMHGVILPPSMGMATAINFQPTAKGAATTGDFVVREGELGALLQTLRAHQIEITAVHNHMLNDEPRMVFVHFWGEGEPAKLARAMRAGLDKLKNRSGTEPATVQRWDFENAALNTLPGYIDAPRGRWEIQEITDSPARSRALVQAANSPRPYFNLAVVSDSKFQDLKLSVRFKPLSGQVDQGGGLVWRYQDPENYYIARANPLENNFRVYKVVGGKREMLQSADVSVSSGQWHTLTVTMRGNRIVCELNGRKYLDARDETFKAAGQVGVWSKADARTAFDDLMAESFEEKARDH